MHNNGGNNRPKKHLRSVGMTVMAQNRFKSPTESTGGLGKRQDSFHYEPTESGLVVPKNQVRRHSIGTVSGTINIAALQENLSANNQVSILDKIYISIMTFNIQLIRGRVIV